MDADGVATLRELAAQVAEIAALPIHDEIRRLWRALNGLRPERPMVMIDQVCWNEMNVDDELTLRTEDEFCRWLETELRRTLYAWRHMPADMVIEPFVRVPKAIHSSGFGVEIVEVTIAIDALNEIVAHEYSDQLGTEEEVRRLGPPVVTHDEAVTAEREEKAHEILDGILGVQMEGWIPEYSPWDDLVTWRGAEVALFDLADRPEHVHEILRRLTDAALAQLDQLETMGLLCYDQPRIHCTGAWTDELPAPGFDPARPRAKDIWTSGKAQILVSASRAALQEFELDYTTRWFERFGLVYYGCCDALHDRIDLVRQIPHLRKISMNPWVVVEEGAEAIGRDFVFSRKPNPALLTYDAWDPAVVEKDLRHVIEATARHGCPLELIQKDISTVRYQPQRLWEWERIAMRLVT